MRAYKNKSLIKGKYLKVPNISVYEGLKHRSNIHTSKVAVMCHERIIRFDELIGMIDLYANACRELGIKRGEIVPLCLPPCVEAVALFFALNKVGAISAFLNYSERNRR